MSRACITTRRRRRWCCAWTRNRASRRWTVPAGAAGDARQPGRRSHDYVRHGTTDLFAALTIADGTVISQLRRHHRAAEFKEFLARIDKNVPAGRRAEPGRQREVAQVVGGELQLVTLGGAGQFGYRHDPGVVDQNVQRAAPASSGTRDRLQVRQVQQDVRDVRIAGRCGDLCRCVAARPVAAGGHDDGRACARQRAGRP